MTSASEEHVIIVDAADNPVGTKEKLAAHRAGSPHRAFSVVIWNNAGALLLQKRYTGKYHSGGLWTNACCGHPRPGEDVHAAARRRLDEEMGFTCPLTPLGTITYRAEFSNGLIEHEIVHVFRGIYAEAIRPNPEEADGYEWADIEEVRRRSRRLRKATASGFANTSPHNGRCCWMHPADIRAPAAIESNTVKNNH